MPGVSCIQHGAANVPPLYITLHFSRSEFAHPDILKVNANFMGSSAFEPRTRWNRLLQFETFVKRLFRDRRWNVQVNWNDLDQLTIRLGESPVVSRAASNIPSV